MGCGWEGWLTADRSPPQAGRPAVGPAVGGDSLITGRDAGRSSSGGQVLQPSGYMKVSSYDNVKPSKTDATAIRRWGCGVVGREGGGGKEGGGKREWREGGCREGVEGREWREEGGWREGGGGGGGGGGVEMEHANGIWVCRAL